MVHQSQYLQESRVAFVILCERGVAFVDIILIEEGVAFVSVSTNKRGVILFSPSEEGVVLVHISFSSELWPLSI